MDPQHLGCTRLVFACAHNTGDDLLWSEFLRRYGPKIKQFVRRACSSKSAETRRYSSILPRPIQESDLFQIVIVRLVEDECAVMRAFCGASESEWLTYLAVITRSVVCDLQRCQGRSKRSGKATLFAEFCWRAKIHKCNQPLEIENDVLAGEVKTICERTIRNLAGERADRDILIFELYFFHDLSVSQIAECQGVDLSRSGIEKVLHRLRRRVRTLVDGKAPQIARSRSGRSNIVNIDERRRLKERRGVKIEERDALSTKS